MSAPTTPSTRAIHRVACAVADRQHFTLSARPIPLHVAPARPIAVADFSFDVWYEIDTVSNESPSTMVVTTVGTGHPIPDDAGDYLGTIIPPSGLVWHIYVRVIS